MAGVWYWTWATAAFGSELAALGVLGWWGATAPDGVLARVLLAVAVPVLAAGLWAVFAAPRAVVDAPLLAVATKLLVFGAATTVLVTAGSPRAGAALAVVAVLGALLTGPAAAPAPVALPAASAPGS